MLTLDIDGRYERYILPNDEKLKKGSNEIFMGQHGDRNVLQVMDL
jgi:hypothetical protein